MCQVYKHQYYKDPFLKSYYQIAHSSFAKENMIFKFYHFSKIFLIKIRKRKGMFNKLIPGKSPYPFY